MSNIVNAVNKDSVIVACKRKAKEILKNSQNNHLTLTQCLDLAAKEMKFSSWYELRNSRKNKLIIKQLSPVEKWESLLYKYFYQDYNSLHFEVRGNVVEIKGRKYGMIDFIVEECSENMLNEVLELLKIEPNNYDWLSQECYNIQTTPVYSIKTQGKSYDIVVVRKDEFELKKVQKIEKNQNSYVKENLHKQNEQVRESLSTTLSFMGFSDNNIKDIEDNFTNKNIFIASVTGSGKSKTADILVNNLIEKGFNVISIDTTYNSEEQINQMISAAIRSDVEYFYIKETRNTNMVNWLNKIIQIGHKVITTIHATSIDDIYNRLKSLGFTEFDYMDNVSNNLFVYQEMVALLCEKCKKHEFSFKKIMQNTAFMNYINKYDKHEQAENNIYIRSNSEMCKNPKCHHGLEGRKIIAETYNTYKDNNNNYYKNIINHDRYIKYDKLPDNEKINSLPINKLKNGKVSEYLRSMSLDCQSNKFEMVLKGQVEL